MPDNSLSDQIAVLLQQAGHSHHQAYLETDGADPDWPLWYAEYLQDQLGRLLNQTFTRSELTYQFVRLDKAYTAQAHKRPWPEFYAEELIQEYTP